MCVCKPIAAVTPLRHANEAHHTSQIYVERTYHHLSYRPRNHRSTRLLSPRTLVRHIQIPAENTV